MDFRPMFAGYPFQGSTSSETGDGNGSKRRTHERAQRRRIERVKEVVKLRFLLQIGLLERIPSNLKRSTSPRTIGVVHNIIVPDNLVVII